jgi:hypothetical protein
MTDNTQPSLQPALVDPSSLLARLIPTDQAERRRAMAALLRALTEDEQPKQAAS